MEKITTLLNPYDISLDIDGKKTDLYIECEKNHLIQPIIF
mgnify:CR=1 FL=1|jgi:hypothetical protein